MNWREREAGIPVMGQEMVWGRDERGKKGKTSGRQGKGKDSATSWICEQDRRRHQEGSHLPDLTPALGLHASAACLSQRLGVRVNDS